MSNETGDYQFEYVPFGEQSIIVKPFGNKEIILKISLDKERYLLSIKLEDNVNLKELSEVVVNGKSQVRQLNDML